MEKARPGQRHIPAKDWNEFRDFMNSYTPKNGGMVNNPGNPFLVTVKNVTGSDLPAFSVVRIDAAMYPDSGDTDLIVATLNNNVELDGDTPTGADGENIAIIQEDIKDGELGKAICSGATLCYVNVSSSGSGDSAKSINDTAKLELATTGQARIIWKQSGTGKKLAYVILDRGGSDSRETFTINYGKSAGDARTNNPALYTKGSLHYIVRNAAGVWVPASGNETPGTPTKYNRARPANSKLVICQEDAPNSEVEYHMPYYTPESNMGVLPTVNSVVSLNEDRFGCFLGDHVFTDKCFDYKKCGNTFVYEPSFLALVQAIGQTGGQQDLYVAVGNEDFDCYVPTYDPTLADNSGPSYPDIWPYDYIVVSFDCESYTAIGLDYPRDYPDGTVMPWYKTWQGTNRYPGRGWEHYDPYGGNPPASGDANCIHFIVKVKTNAIT